MKAHRLLYICIIMFIIIGCKHKDTSNKVTSTIDSIVIAIPHDSIHNARNSLDWEGEYKGILPCEDCDGVETSLILNFDNTFTQTVIYIGKGGPYESKGTFHWDESGFNIILVFEDKSEAEYKVMENAISLIDVYGEMQADYTLRK